MHSFSEADWLVALHSMYGVGWHTLKKINDICGGFHCLPRTLSDHADALRAVRVSVEPMINYLSRPETKRWLSRLKEREVRTLTVLDGDYPPLLREIAQPPWVLYVLGDQTLLNKAALAVVGTRQPTHYGRTVARKLGYQLAERGVVVVSGMARGIDSEAHRGAIDAQGATVAILGCGVDVVYPKSNTALYRTIVKTGAVVSEFPLGTQPRPGLFPQRNRIISGLSRGTVVVEAGEKSGSLITADMSLEQNRDVFAIPGPITSPQSKGCNKLIQQGAKCVADIQDILEEYPDWLHERERPLQGERESEQLTLEESAILEALGVEPIHVDVLCGRTSLPVAQIHTVLISLQVKRLVKQLPGSRFVRV